MKTILLAAALLVGSSATAQSTWTPKPLKVYVAGDDNVKQAVNAEFTRLLSLDAHYTLVTDIHYDVMVHLTCVEPMQGRYACSYAFIYSPDAAFSAEYLLGDGVVAAVSTDEAARLLFSSLIQSSTQDKLTTGQHYFDQLIGGIMKMTRAADAQRKAGG